MNIHKKILNLFIFGFYESSIIQNGLNVIGSELPEWRHERIILSILRTYKGTFYDK